MPTCWVPSVAYAYELVNADDWRSTALAALPFQSIALPPDVDVRVHPTCCVPQMPVASPRIPAGARLVNRVPSQRTGDPFPSLGPADPLTCP